MSQRDNDRRGATTRAGRRFSCSLASEKLARRGGLRLSNMPAVLPSRAAMSETRCLNCDEIATARYCSHCGQATDTSRLTTNELFTNHLFKAIFFVDGNFFSTLKDVLFRPGHMARDYINGKRVSSFGPFKLLAVLAICEGFFRHLRGYTLASTVGDPSVHHLVELIEHFRTSHQKWLVIGAVPFQALFSFAWFRSARQNYAEHFILSTFSASAGLVVSTVAWALASSFGALHVNIVHAGTYVAIAYTILFHWQYFSRSGYSAFALALRSIAAATSFYLLLTVGVVIYLLAR